MTDTVINGGTEKNTSKGNNMAEYKYNCNQCGKKYSEHRASTDPQWFTNCDVCTGQFVEVTE